MSEIPEWVIGIVAALLLIGPVGPAIVTFLFAPDFWSHHWPTRERAGLAVRDLLQTGAFATLAAAYLTGWDLGPILGFTLVALAYLSAQVPSWIWIWLYWTGRFR